MSDVIAADRTKGVNIDRAVPGFAGVVNLAGVLLAWLVSLYWLLLPAFVSLNLLQASITGFCPAAMLLKRLGVKTGCAFK